MPPAWAEEIDVFERQIYLRKQGKIEERLFAETRLRRGVYGQRYDNGQRHDGVESRTLAFPSGDLTKGPSTFWDAPGMQRIKIPFGKLSAEQLDVLAELAEEYSDAILHLLLAAGLPIDARGQHNATPLHWAAWHGNAELVRLMLQRHPPLENDDNEFGATPLGWATHGSENGWYRQNGDYAATVEALLAAGAKPPEKAAGTEAVRVVLREHGAK
jgi:hypothetical protein